MRIALLALLLCAFAAAPAQAGSCFWTVWSNISPPDTRHDIDSGSDWPSFWSWQYVVSANHYTIYGDMTAYAYRCTTNLSAAATGNATFIVARTGACIRPLEDIEADARNEFTARAEINNDTYAQARGSERIHAPKMGLDCHSCGGVEATSTGYGSGNSGYFTVPLFPGGPSMVVFWSKGGSMEQAFQASDSKVGGRTPETFYCQTSLSVSVSVGWWEDSGLATIKNPKAELKAYGTCDGYCQSVVAVIADSVGY